MSVRPLNRPPARFPRALAVGVCLLAALLYLLTWSGVLHTVDEQSALSVAESLLAGQGFHVNQMEWDQARTPPQNAYGLDQQPLFQEGDRAARWRRCRCLRPGKLLTPAVGAGQSTLLMGSLLALVAVWAMFSAGARPRLQPAGGHAGGAAASAGQPALALRPHAVQRDAGQRQGWRWPCGEPSPGGVQWAGGAQHGCCWPGAVSRC